MIQTTPEFPSNATFRVIGSEFLKKKNTYFFYKHKMDKNTFLICESRAISVHQKRVSFDLRGLGLDRDIKLFFQAGTLSARL